MRKKYTPPRSEKIFPKNTRPTTRNLLKGSMLKTAITALNAVEKNYRELQRDVLNIIDGIESREEKLTKKGYFMEDAPVLPRDAGFTSQFEMVDVLRNDNKIEKEVFRLADIYMYHIQGPTWIIGRDRIGPVIFQLPHMTAFLIVLTAFGAEIDVEMVAYG